MSNVKDTRLQAQVDTAMRKFDAHREALLAAREAKRDERYARGVVRAAQGRRADDFARGIVR